MKLSTRGRYALRMMIDIARQGAGQCVAIKEISEREGISLKYMEQIVPNLTRADLLKSVRGPQGGYMLVKSPEDYTVGQIIRAIEGDVAPVACLEGADNTCVRKDICSTLKVWTGLKKVIDEYIDSITLRDLI